MNEWTSYYRDEVIGRFLWDTTVTDEWWWLTGDEHRRRESLRHVTSTRRSRTVCGLDNTSTSAATALSLRPGQHFDVCGSSSQSEAWTTLQRLWQHLSVCGLDNTSTSVAASLSLRPGQHFDVCGSSSQSEAWTTLRRLWQQLARQSRLPVCRSRGQGLGHGRIGSDRSASICSSLSQWVAIFELKMASCGAFWKLMLLQLNCLSCTHNRVSLDIGL